MLCILDMSRKFKSCNIVPGKWWRFHFCKGLEPQLCSTKALAFRLKRVCKFSGRLVLGW